MTVSLQGYYFIECNNRMLDLQILLSSTSKPQLKNNCNWQKEEKIPLPINAQISLNSISLKTNELKLAMIYL